MAWWDHLARTVRKCRLLRPYISPDGHCSLLQSAHKGDIIASARWDKAHCLWSSSVSSFSHCTYSLPLNTHWLYSPPSLSYYPPPTTGQFVPPAWLPPPLLLRYLAPLLHFNGRYWLENFHDLFAISQKSPLPFPATFNLITGFLQLFRGGQSQEDNSRPSGFTNTLARVIWFTRGGAFTLLQHQVPARSACTVM